MKKLKLYILLTAAVLGFSACENYFDDVNVDPNNPAAVTPSALLSTIEVRLAYSVWGDGSRYLGLNTQHIDGVARQFVVYQNYGLTPSDLDALWGQNLYSGVLMDINQLLTISEAENYNLYSGIAKALEAYTILFIADMWGDAPYTESFGGLDNLQPRFDSQQELFNTVFAKLDEAENLLKEDPGILVPGSDDLIYGGNSDAWTKFVNVLRARAYLHLGKVDAANYQNALDALAAGGFTAGGDDARLPFADNPTSAASWYQYIEQRDDIEVGDSYKALLQSLNDPRDTIFGAPLDIPHPLFKRDRAAPLLTYTEQKFIEAECLMQTSGAADAHPAYLEGIRASFAELVDPFKDFLIDKDEVLDDYLAQSIIDPGAGSLTMEDIMTQKYIALFADPEVFNDWRRTGIPELVPNTGSEIPRRLPYAENEILQNTNTPSPDDIDMFDRVWWDQ